ncbi:MAG TPA: tetratricopeptide repeat protein [Kofleriaceae bacterium]|nr:tetratricopeptide repeat protein [Kofleriaceae bacterium]
MARAADVFRLACPHCRTGRVLAGDGRGSIPAAGAFAVHDCFACGLAAADIAAAIARDGLPRDAEPSDHGQPLARAHYAEELARCERAFGAASWPAIRCHIALGRNFEMFGDARALEHFRRAADAYEHSAEPYHPDWFALFAALGYRLKSSGDAAEARRCYARLYRLYRRALGPGHLLVADCCRLVGDLACSLGAFAGARAFYERELALWDGATDDEIAAYRAGHRDVPAEVARSTYALYPLHRDTGGDYRAHQRVVARAKLAQAIGGLGGDPACVVDDEPALAAAVGDFLFYTDKAFATAQRLYEVARAASPDDATVAAKLEMARAFVR